jgi:uncharacterized repeat protein (TIGR03809 family)
MLARLPPCTSIETTQKWRALAVQRRDHFVELYESGRWKHYYTEHELLARMREAIRLVETWDLLCIPPAAASATIAAA